MLGPDNHDDDAHDDGRGYRKQGNERENQQNRIGEMKRLTAESLPIFRALGIDREALAALALFERAVDRERISLRWIAELAGYLQRARCDPKLAFQPPA